jgi:hypothetical protein
MKWSSDEYDRAPADLVDKVIIYMMAESEAKARAQKKAEARAKKTRR